jgi:hypothetical protein
MNGLMEMMMRRRRGLLSSMVGTAALAGGLSAISRGSARAAAPAFVGIDG